MSFEKISVFFVLAILVVPVLTTLYAILFPLLEILRLRLAGLYFIFLVCAINFSDWFLQREKAFMLSLYILIGISLAYAIGRFIYKKVQERKDNERLERNFNTLVKFGLLKHGDTVRYEDLDF